MADLKTKPNDGSVINLLNSISNPVKREDSFKILEMMKKITGHDPVLWGESIIGFGQRHYKYATGREGDWFITGFAPRKQNITLYIEDRIDNHTELLSGLGKHKSSVSCLYIKKLSDIDIKVLEKLIKASVSSILLEKQSKEAENPRVSDQGSIQDGRLKPAHGSVKGTSEQE